MHITTSVGLLGSVAVFLALALVGLSTQDAQIIRAVYLGMQLVARLVIVPLAFAALLIGIVQSLGTPWGLFRHYWVLLKLLLTALATIILLMKLDLIVYAARMAAETVLRQADLHAAGLQLAVHAAGGLVVLLVPAMLSVYKPMGLTPYARRGQSVQCAPLQQRHGPPQRSARAADRSANASPFGGSIVVTLSQGRLLQLFLAVLVAHLFVLHLFGVLAGGH
ncbi:MAG: hypothetical protein ABI645_13205 [Pseudomonadota bacterium]